jgi:hypothetical protein
MAETADSGGLLVQIGVTQARMERELASLVKSAAKAAQQTEDSFRGANDNIGKSFQGLGKSFSTTTAGASKGVQNTTNAVTNLSYQLNDIGVQLAGGQSPFLIMLQQGTQISQLFNQTGGSIKSFGSILTGAITSALNPFSLLTFAIIGLGGAAVQYFASVMSGGEDANKVIEEQAKLIQNVAKTWGDAVPALQAYVDALASAKDAAELIKASEGLASDQWALARKEVEDVNVAFAALLQDLRLAGESEETINSISEAFQNLRQKVEDGKATTQDMDAVTQALASTVYSAGIPSLADFASQFAGLGQTIAGATAQAMRFRQEALNALAIGKNGPALGTLSPLFSENGKFQTQESFQPKDVPTPESRPLIELQGLPGEFKADGSLAGRKRGGGASKRGANSYKDEVSGIKERTAALRESTAAQAAVNPLVNDYGFALEKAKAEQKLLADAQRSGLTITPQLRDQISELATGYAQASVEAKQLSESQNKIRKNAEEWASLEKDVFKGFISDLKDGKSGAEALSNALNKVADKLLDMAVNSIFDTKSGSAGGGGGIFSSLLGGIGKLFGFSSGTANTGGKRGQPAGVVHGQEAVIPLPAGGKVPVQIASPSVPSGKSSRDVVAINLTDDSGRMSAIADQRIQTASGTIVQVSVTQSYKQVKSNMASLITDTQQRSL